VYSPDTVGWRERDQAAEFDRMKNVLSTCERQPKAPAPAPFPASASWWRSPASLARLLIGLVAVLVVAYLYVFFASAGRMYPWNYATSYYNLLADGLRAGHLHLSVEPRPELLAMADPTDLKHESLWLWDASLYQGHYYLYWGPVPGILLAIIKSILRMTREVQDQYIVWSFVFARFILGAALLRTVASHFSARASSWTTMLAIAVWAFANPTPYLLARGAVYEVAIASGQFFLVAGVFCAFRGICAARLRSSRIWLALAGASWGLSLGSRLPLAAAVAPLVVLSAFACWRNREQRQSRSAGSWLRGLKDLASAGAPVLASLFLLGWYNHARFGSWTDSGIDYQLTSGKFSWNKSFIVANLYSYLIRPMKLTCRFPFLDTPEEWTSDLPKWIDFPSNYSWHESSAGIFVTAPWACLGALMLVYLTILLIRRTVPRARSIEGSVNWTFLFCVAAALILAMAPAAAILGMWLATMRYQADIGSGVMLLGAIGCWSWVYRTPWRRVRTVGVAACALLGAATIIMGLLMGFRGYSNQFERNNPSLYKKLARLEVCKEKQ
jgi:hypothetical protein